MSISRVISLKEIRNQIIDMLLCTIIKDIRKCDKCECCAKCDICRKCFEWLNSDKSETNNYCLYHGLQMKSDDVTCLTKLADFVD